MYIYMYAVTQYCVDKANKLQGTVHIIIVYLNKTVVNKPVAVFWFTITQDMTLNKRSIWYLHTISVA